MNRQTFFSVIIPSFNREPLLGTAVTSVLRQTYGNFELLVVDDGSTDGTKGLISSFKDKRINYFYQPNRGVSGARNAGLRLSRGPFLAFLDSDDRWVPEKLEKTLKYIKKFPDVNIFHTEEIWYKGGKLLPQKEKHRKPSGFVYPNALPLCSISISTAVVKRDVFDSVGAFDEDLEACEDYDFWLRATYRYKVMLIPEELTLKDGGRADQLTSRIWGLDRFRIEALEKMLASGSLRNSEDYDLTFKELEKKCAIFAAGSEKRGKKKEAIYYTKLPLKYKR